MRSEERDSWRRADALVAELIELDPAERRSAAAQAIAAAADPALAARIEALLDSLELDTGPLDVPLDLEQVRPAEPPPAERSLAGRRLGAYVLDEEIGRGGMAVVYAAHRADGGFAQRVAVKVLGTGLLATSAAARFHREQELLARLRHPRIATLLDGGVAEDGTPFLVMELIAGRPIDDYCEAAGLETRQRVELLLQVCDAVAYAHRNLVVHRDLKPGNILITADGEAKLLDFGIAKLLAPDAEGEPTQLRSRLLTPSYAAPEQVEGHAVTTATDVYGLGKVLARLLADRVIDRDLANVRARALHADPERRYADARALGEELRRWLEGRPVQATPDSLLYRLRKGLQRRRGAVAAALVVLAVGAAGLVATLRSSAKARRAEREASAVSSFLIGLFEAGDPAQHRGRELSVGELLDRGAAQARSLHGEPLLRARLLEVLGGVQHSLGQNGEASERWREAIAILAAQPRPDEARLADLHDNLGIDLMLLDRHDEAEAELRGALAARRKLFGDDHSAVAESLDHLGQLVGVQRGDFDAAEPLLREAVRLRRQTGEPGRLELAISLNNLGRCLSRLRRHQEAEAALREALAIHRAALGADHPLVADDLNGLGNVLSRAGRRAEAEPLQRQALAMRLKLFGERHGAVGQSLVSLGVVLHEQGKLDEAAPVFARAISVYRQLFGADHQAAVISTASLAEVELQRGQLDHALELFQSALAATARSASGTPRERWRATIGLGATLQALGRLDEATPVLREALEQAQRLPGDRETSVAQAQLELGLLELERGRVAAAEALFASAEAAYRKLVPGRRSAARAALWLGICRARMGRRVEAEAQLRSAAEMLRRMVPPAHPERQLAEEELQRLATTRGAT